MGDARQGSRGIKEASSSLENLPRPGSLNQEQPSAVEQFNRLKEMTRNVADMNQQLNPASYQSQ